MCFSRCVRRHAAQQHDRALDRVAADMVERPHVLVVEAQMRLLDQRLAVGADEAEILDGVGKVPAVVALLPLAAAAEAAHGGGRTALVLGREGDLVGPAALLAAVGEELAVDLIDHDVLADQARHQAAPAAMRVDVAVLLVEQHVGLARHCSCAPYHFQ